jgi:drug/metabolite transporter (DMT)-like permease
MKLTVNEANKKGFKETKKLFKYVLRQPKWVIGFLLQYIGGASLSFAAQILIGPILIPGLSAISLIFLAIFSFRLLKEKIRWPEYIAIAIIVCAIALLGMFSRFKS